MTDEATAAVWVAAIVVLGIAAAFLIWDLVKVKEQATVTSIVPEPPAADGNGDLQ